MRLGEGPNELSKQELTAPGENRCQRSGLTANSSSARRPGKRLKEAGSSALRTARTHCTDRIAAFSGSAMPSIVSMPSCQLTREPVTIAIA